MKSLSEIETTVKRASKAAGFSWGVSEETGKSIRLLELFSLPGIKHLNEYFNEKNKSKFENLNLISENNSSSNNPYCPITLGVSFLDQINILEKFKKIEFKNVAYPIIFISFISRSSKIRDFRLSATKFTSGSSTIRPVFPSSTSVFERPISLLMTATTGRPAAIYSRAVTLPAPPATVARIPHQLLESSSTTLL